MSIDGQATIKVNKADIPDTAITAPEPISELVYKIGGNTPQTLHIGGSIANGYGTMKYITGNPNAAESEWSETPISATDAGDYVVYYKVFGDKNHNDSAYGTIKCHIEKYEIYYKVICKTKLYDGKTDAEFESITFYPYPTGDEQISLSADDYEVKNLKYKSSDPCGPFGTDRVYATGDIALKDTPAVRNYKLEKDGLIYGYIKPNYFPDMGNFHDYEMEIRYNDMTPKTFGASAFGAKNDKEYKVSSDGMKHDGTDEKLLHGEIGREINSDGTCSFKIYKMLDESYIGKKFVEKMIINSKDGKYCSDPYGKQTLSVIITIVDKATPKLSVNPITTEYDGKAVPSNKITGTATYDGNVVAGTWSWENSEHAPKNVSDSGEYTVVFTPDDQETYVEKVTKKVNVTIRPKPIDDVSLTLDKDSFTYNGGEQKPTITVKMNDTDLVENTDYTVTNLTDMTNVGTKEIKIKGMGNFNGEKTVSYRIDKATVKVKPKNITKIYGGEPVFALESESTLITADELAEVEKTVKFTSDGAAKTAPVTEGGYEISAQLTNKETDNLILEVEGKGVLTVTPAPLTITVNDVSREYGAVNPELSVSYNGFVNGENESVLNGTLTLAYDESINGTTPVNTYDGKTTASGLSAKNYNINYVPGKVTITKIPVSVTAGAARRSYLSVEFDKSLEGLADTNFVVKDSEGNTVAVTNVTASSDSKTYTLSGSFEVGRKYTVKVVLNGAAVETTHRLVNDEIVSIPVHVSSGGGGGSTRYTVSFDTNGGSKLASQRVKRNSVITEPTAPTKEGFDFAGWYTDKELKTKYNFSAKVTKSMTLYAAWTEKDNSANQIILTIGEKKALVFGKTKINDVAPKIVNDRTMLPARFVAENLGADVSWNEGKELVTITRKNLKTGENVTILVNIDSDVAYVNGREVKLDSPAFIENDRTYTPIRFISEELGASVEWFETEQKVVITR